MIPKLTAYIFILLLSTQVNAQTTKYIIVRHAEKDTTLADAKMMASDPPLNSI